MGSSRTCITTNGVVDEETQKNDLDIVREVFNISKEVPSERAYDFSFSKNADSELRKQTEDLRNFSRVGLPSVALDTKGEIS